MAEEPTTDGSGAPVERGPRSRERFLDAATELVLEHFGSGTRLRDVFAYLTPGSVADRAGLSRALLYHHWGSTDHEGSDAFESFLVELCERLVQASVPTDALAELAESLPDQVADVVTTVAAFEMDRSEEWATEEWRVTISLALQCIGAEHHEVLLDRLAAFHRRVAERLGREPVPPLTYHDLALAAMAVIDGFSLHGGAIRQRALRPLDWPSSEPRSEPGPDWTLVSISLESIVVNMTRPVPQR